MDSQEIEKMLAEAEAPIEIPKEEKPADDKEEEKLDWKKELWEYARMVIVLFLLVLFCQNFIYVNAKIPSGSMENTVMTGDRVFGNRLAYYFGDPERYDIVIFRYPDDETKLFIKRVIGLPGETVTIMADGIYINDATEPLSESFCPEIPDYSPWIGQSWTVPEGCYFLLGDNRNHSGDSRYWNNPFVAKKKVLAKAGLRYWPLNKLKVIGRYDPSFFEPEGES